MQREHSPCLQPQLDKHDMIYFFFCRRGYLQKIQKRVNNQAKTANSVVGARQIILEMILLLGVCLKLFSLSFTGISDRADDNVFFYFRFLIFASSALVRSHRSVKFFKFNPCMCWWWMKQCSQEVFFKEDSYNSYKPIFSPTSKNPTSFYSEVIIYSCFIFKSKSRNSSLEKVVVIMLFHIKTSVNDKLFFSFSAMLAIH